MPVNNFLDLYPRFDAPVTPFDCGLNCAPHNPKGIPACCDICCAVPVAYLQEWDELRRATNLWRPWQPGDCPEDPTDPETLRADLPDDMTLLACLGPAHCQRPYRAISCRQFPFFPYIDGRDRFIGLAYEWEFESGCWVISNLGSVSQAYRDEFVAFYEYLFVHIPYELEEYAALSEEMRRVFAARRRRIPLLHRRGGYYLLSPTSQRLQRVSPAQLPQYRPFVG